MANPNWQKGMASPNPSGRSVAANTWAQQCREFMQDAGGFQKLVDIANDAGHKEQLKALQFIAEHAYGRAVTQIAGADESEFSKLRIIIVDEATKDETNDESSADCAN